MKLTKEYCDICKVDITDHINTKSISFTPQFFIRRSQFDVCPKCADKVRKYISFLANEIDNCLAGKVSDEFETLKSREKKTY